MSKVINSLPNTKETVSITNIDYNGPNLGYKTVTLHHIPRELDYSPDTKWVVIPSIGRNVPFYHYTGSEDTLEFEVDWYADDAYRSEAIKQARLLESFSKNNAYLNGPPRVTLSWGNEGLLFRGVYWIVEKAPYKLKQFNRYTIGEDGVYYNSLYPVQVIQTITLKKVSNYNLSSEDISNTLVSSTPPVLF
jgi:hypothetical protein